MAQPTVSGLIELTEIFLRFYLALAQYLDCTLDKTATRFTGFVSVDDLQFQLAATRDELVGLVSVNRVVKAKVGQDYDRICALGTSQKLDVDAVNGERACDTR